MPPSAPLPEKSGTARSARPVYEVPKPPSQTQLALEAAFTRLMSLPMLRYLGGKGQWTSSSKAVLGVVTLLTPVGLLGLVLNTGGFGLSDVSLWSIVVPLALQTIILVAGASALAGWRTRRFHERVSTIETMLRELQEGRYKPRGAALDGTDEIDQLTRRIDAVAEGLAERERRIGEHALTDPLTGLANRALLTDRIRHTVRASERRRESFGLMVMDLDRFKVINDTLGHAAGDAVLKEVSRRLKRAVRDCDTVARLGGDEFVMLLPGPQNVSEDVARRILQLLREPLRWGDQLIDIGASLGISIFPQHGQDEATLMRRADSAMYLAKRRQSGSHVFDGVESGQQRSYLSMLGEMRKALESGQFELHFQPKLDLSSGLIVGAEGLLRWKHPVRGRIPPTEFIPFAEQTGFMRQITRWVVREGARFGRELADAGLAVRLSVNVTATDIQTPGFAQEIGEILKAQNSSGEHLCLEITESGVVSESAAALQSLREISAMGVKLSVDDFGTGYATLKQLQQLPVHELKIDQSFVAGLINDNGNESIVRSTIDLGRHMGLRVVAEGVENLQQMRALAQLGCHEVQGFYIAKPMRQSELVGWVKMRHSLHENSKQNYFEMMAGRAS
ncbi:MAG: EAL domain-containing protein [Burkholderiales bacterium]